MMCTRLLTIEKVWVGVAAIAAAVAALFGG